MMGITPPWYSDPVEFLAFNAFAMRTSQLEQVAKEHNTTPEEVDVEMRTALHMAGYDIEPAMFIALATAKVKKTIYRN